MKYEKRSVCFHFYKRFSGNQITMENLSTSSSKEVEMKQQLELTLRALEMELKTVRNDLNQVEQSLVKFSVF